MDILINKKYRIRKIPNNIVIEEKKKVVKDDVTTEEWVDPKYFYYLKSACEYFVNEVAINSNATSVEELIKVIEKSTKQIVKAVETYGKNFEIDETEIDEENETDGE